MKQFLVLLALFVLTSAEYEKTESLEERTAMHPRQRPVRLCPTFPPCPTVPHPGAPAECGPYPYGTCSGDAVMDPNDDSGVLLPLDLSIRFFGVDYNQIYVNNNGLLTFDAIMVQWTPQLLPKGSNPNEIIAPYWSDIDTRFHGGEVLYRQVTSGSDLARAQADVEDALPGIPNFTAKIAIIVTWHDVTFFGASLTGQTKRNTFQAVVISDGPRTFAFFIYDKLEWTTGTASGGNSNTGLGGTPALAGFDAGDGTNYYNVPFSLTSDVLTLTDVTNINGPFMGKNGCWFSQFNLIGTLAPLMKCLQDGSCCLMKGNYYRATHACSSFCQWDYLNHPAPYHPGQNCPASLEFNTFPTVCVCDWDYRTTCHVP